MRHDILAPWAEPVPGAPYPMTVADLLTLPDDEWFYELVEGRLVRMPGSGNRASSIASYLIAILVTFVRPGKLGRVTGGTGQYDLTLPGATAETALIPDVAFVQAGRLPPLMNTPAIPHLAPDLAVEVASPSQSHRELDEKARLYLQAGVRLVWIVWPAAQTVDVWLPGATTPARTLTIADTLDGLSVLPGFSHPVADLFTD